MSGLLWNTAALSTESSQPPYGPAPAPLDGPELPSFRYSLGAQKTEQFNGGTAKEANVTGFPVSEKLAGVYMTLEPGALRELHWHANAAEWAYVIEGNCRVTTIDPAGQCEIVDFGPGDVWYFPRGHGHSIQGIGPGTCVFLLVFDNGYFSEFGTFSISDWIGHTPPEVLARNFGVPASTFADFPKKEVYINTGPVPPPLPAEPAPGSLNEPPLTHQISPARGKARDNSPAARCGRVIGERISDLDHHDRRAAHHRARRHARAALAPARGRVAVLHQGQRADDGVRQPRACAHRSVRRGDVGYVPQGYGHYIENTGQRRAGDDRRVQ